ncbi:hypothetical protein G6F68_013447 [Rhizopus microsporus]|nr:hypothetical protein G6F68_013447 [Rhizopus microsporus]
MLRNRIAFYASLLKRPNTVGRIAYSSLRRPRQLGPRSRVLNHVETIRPKPTRTLLQEHSIDSVVYEKPSPTNVDALVEVPVDKEHQVVKPNTSSAALLTQSAIAPIDTRFWILKETC